ncbi:Myb-like DNA-binding domain containing protein [Tritrichomonas foetus]|uniref:Myb-like DNA-binding domain containing protein n=1 Tax=Tritrichomonas foetus TaxID=1144522 RepID=A0A1J4KJW0_9EUKA|nr:Myb-like DNA-binding domain containing protein [Tritrichomonas foetus]|eukprot:OHT11593.1 Myb-like DNA-binding domain containing protein [Tritrichomonas foetus]
MKSELSGPTILACTELVLSYYPTTLNAIVSSKISMGIMQFLNSQMEYSQLSTLSKSLTGTTEPIDKLQQIMSTSSDPIPTPDENDKKNQKKSRGWSQYEDQRLLKGIFTLGIDNWAAISKFVGNGRTRSQCSQRWFRGLDPKISKDNWALADEQKLLQLVNQFGEKSWTAIAQHMGNRSDVQCRYRYQQILRRNKNIGEYQAQKQIKMRQKIQTRIPQIEPVKNVPCPQLHPPEDSIPSLFDMDDSFSISFDTDHFDDSFSGDF